MRNFKTTALALASIGLAMTLVGCAGGSCEPATSAVPTKAAPTATSTPTPVLTAAHPEVGRRRGVVGTGDSLACAAGLRTLKLSTYETVTYNGTTIASQVMHSRTTPENLYGTRLIITGKPLHGVKAVIVRMDDFFTDISHEESFSYPALDKFVSWTPAMNLGTVEFDKLDFNSPVGINDISGLDVCIDEVA